MIWGITVFFSNGKRDECEEKRNNVKDKGGKGERHVSGRNRSGKVFGIYEIDNRRGGGKKNRGVRVRFA